MTPSTLITVAPTGAEARKDEVPALPVTLEELLTSAKQCQEAGAAVIHVHIRDQDASPTLDLGRLTETVRALRESTDLIVQVSTGGALAAGGHLRVGMEDTLSFARGRPVSGNAELVERVAALAALAQRPAMAPKQAREFLGVRDRH
jgi:uncharacterized protein (DUF849 family)